MKVKQINNIPKLLQPKINNTYRCERLFHALKQREQQRVIWLSAPAGSGKTTLIASYLGERNTASIWYQVDEGDADVASFFYYFGLSAQKLTENKFSALPSLTPEYQQNIAIYARNYFREFFHRFDDSLLMVFDNYQDVPEDSSLHKVIDILLQEIPNNCQAIIISRENPPAELSRTSISSDFSTLNWDELKLTDTECQELIRKKSDTVLSKERLHKMTKISQGWMAGLVLLLKQNDANRSEIDAHNINSHADLFGYFTNEIFSVFSENAQQALLLTSLFPSFTMDMAKTLTGQPEVDKFISDLTINQFFILQDTDRGDSYEYHPLFRAFLQNRFSIEFTKKQQEKIQRQAARLLSENGLNEDAAALLIKIKDWLLLSELINAHAQNYISQGRYQTLQSWFNSIPEGIREADPWLLYWQGNCTLAFNPAQARDHFKLAFSIFNSGRIQAGQLLSWSGVINTFMYEWGDFRAADEWIKAFDDLYAENPNFPTVEIGAQVASSILSILMWRQPQRPDLLYWAEQVKSIVLNLGNNQLRVLLGNNLVIYHLWIGNLSSATLVIEALREAGTSEHSDPLTRLSWYVMEAMHAWFTADHDTCLAAISAGNELANSSGIHLLDLYLDAQGVYSGLTQADLPLANRLLKNMTSLNIARLMDKSLLHYQLGSAAWREGDLNRSEENYYASVELAEQTGTALPEALCRFELAVTLYKQEKYGLASQQLDKALKVGRGMNHIEFMILLHSADVFLAQNNMHPGLEHLSKAMSLGAQQGYVNHPNWDNAVMARLCGTALDHDIEVEYVQYLIRQRCLEAVEAVQHLENWPWAIQIDALGRFTVTNYGKQISSAGKSQRKPLHLLKSLVASGERGIPIEQVIELLWPDMDGDKAYHAYTSAVYRLRKLLDCEDAIVTENGRVGLNKKRCWIDAWNFENLLTLAESQKKSDMDTAWRTFMRATKLYHGSYLNNEQTDALTITYQEHLHNRYIQTTLNLGQILEAQSQFVEALELYQKSLAYDDLRESLYQRILICCSELGWRAEGLDAFERCQSRLNESLGIPPSEQTCALRDKLTRKL